MLGKIVADGILFFFIIFSEKIRLGISCELSARHFTRHKMPRLILSETIQKMSSAVVMVSTLIIKNADYDNTSLSVAVDNQQTKI